LKDWLPKVINAVQPWLSSADIEKGARWSTDVASKLETARVGIICLTSGNVHSDWILFEAGALSKTLQNTFVCPLLVDLAPADIRGPLAQFQATGTKKPDVKRLIITINSALGEKALADAHLDDAFEVWWPRLEGKILALPAEDESPKPQRSEREILEEILALVRSEAREPRSLKTQAFSSVNKSRSSQRIFDLVRSACSQSGLSLLSASTAFLPNGSLRVTVNTNEGGKDPDFDIVVDPSWSTAQIANTLLNELSVSRTSKLEAPNEE
jgi:hypothetical protein